MRKNDNRICACGCGRSITHLSGQARYASAACRKRANRRERGESPSPVTVCVCGCGNPAIGPRKLYATNACKQRQYRRRKEFDELGAMYEWDERPAERPSKGEQRKRRISQWEY